MYGSLQFEPGAAGTAQGTPEVKEVVCLANSRKLGGRCVAGKEIVDGGVGPWVRPVSARECGEVSASERRYKDRRGEPQILDVVGMPLLSHRPKNHQPENWLLNPDQQWEYRGRIGWNQLAVLADADDALWGQGDSTYDGVNDRIEHDEHVTRDSLRLIHVDGLELVVLTQGERFGEPRRRLQGRFRYREVMYHLWVTDPVYERAYLAKDNGRYTIGETYLTVSFGDPYRGSHYKLIAAVIERDGGPRA